MICPNCGKETNSEKNNCEYCGSSLFGPQSILLNEPEFNSSIDKNNMKSITGIDINDIARNDKYVNPPVETGSVLNSKLNSNYNKQNYDTGVNKTKKDFDFKVIILVILIVIIALLCLYIFLNKPEKCEEVKCPEKEEVTSEVVKGTNGQSMNYTFILPDGYTFYEEDNIVYIQNNNVNMKVNPFGEGMLDKVSSSSIKEKYNSVISLEVLETILNQKKLYMIFYNDNGKYYADFYYQYDSNRIIYGSIYSSNNREVLKTDEVKSIVASFKETVNNSFVFSSSNFNQNEVLNILM